MAPPHSYMLLPNNNANHLHPQICFTHRFGQNHTYTVWYGLCWQEESKFCTIMCNVCKSWSTLLVRLLTPICSVLLSTDCRLYTPYAHSCLQCAAVHGLHRLHTPSAHSYLQCAAVHGLHRLHTPSAQAQPHDQAVSGRRAHTPLVPKEAAPPRSGVCVCVLACNCMCEGLWELCTACVWCLLVHITPCCTQVL